MLLSCTYVFKKLGPEMLNFSLSAGGIQPTSTLLLRNLFVIHTVITKVYFLLLSVLTLPS